ncbi:MAG: hypothetical protein Homavirus10_5 [Homavirus sp.]|uniref:Uncharacterized protein n=1 Tax=Homavirus sp. TaxID=2487769 RepID=A0A3G5A4G4_9VIRU|nr:MAG: hypothetical protein Homavirus10_5 [Homavirus sp.]
MEDNICVTKIYKHPNNNKNVITITVALVAVLLWALMIINHRSCRS